MNRHQTEFLGNAYRQYLDFLASSRDAGVVVRTCDSTLAGWVGNDAVFDRMFDHPVDVAHVVGAACLSEGDGAGKVGDRCGLRGKAGGESVGSLYDERHGAGDGDSGVFRVCGATGSVEAGNVVIEESTGAVDEKPQEFAEKAMGKHYVRNRKKKERKRDARKHLNDVASEFRGDKYKVSVLAVRANVEALCDAAFSLGAGVVQGGKYTECVYESVGIGRYRSASDALPAVGEPGKSSVESMVKLDFDCENFDVAEAVAGGVRRAHLFECPTIDVVRLVQFTSVVDDKLVYASVNEDAVPEWRRKGGGAHVGAFAKCSGDVQKNLRDSYARMLIGQNEAKLVKAEAERRRVAALLKSQVIEREVENKRLKLDSDLVKARAQHGASMRSGFAETIVSEGLQASCSVPELSDGSVSPDSSISVAELHKLNESLSRASEDRFELRMKLQERDDELQKLKLERQEHAGSARGDSSKRERNFSSFRPRIHDGNGHSSWSYY